VDGPPEAVREGIPGFEEEATGCHKTRSTSDEKEDSAEADEEGAFKIQPR
jgi:hypothetical protein